jgi:hypothetical protein
MEPAEGIEGMTAVDLSTAVPTGSPRTPTAELPSSKRRKMKHSFGTSFMLHRIWDESEACWKICSNNETGRIGDCAQLGPVSNKYVFESAAWRAAAVTTFELTEPTGSRSHVSSRQRPVCERTRLCAYGLLQLGKLRGRTAETRAHASRRLARLTSTSTWCSRARRRKSTWDSRRCARLHLMSRRCRRSLQSTRPSGTGQPHSPPSVVHQCRHAAGIGSDKTPRRRRARGTCGARGRTAERFIAFNI